MKTNSLKPLLSVTFLTAIIVMTLFTVFSRAAQPSKAAILADVISTSPTANTVNAPRNSNVSATFGDGLAAAPTFTVNGMQSGQVDALFLEWFGTNATYNPGSDFFPGELVQATARYDAGSTPTTWQFFAATSTAGEGLFTFANSFGNKSLETRSVAVGDVDGDGDLDAVAGNWGSTNKLHLNNGDGTFGAGADLGADTGNTRSIALGDVDGDGDLDAVAGNGGFNGGSTNKLYLNNGDGTFTAGADLGADTGNTFSIALGDVDGDGDLDAVAGNSGFGIDGARNKIYINNGDGTFGDGVDLGADTDSTRSIALGDVDGDGYLDAVVGNYWDSTNKLYLNNGDGTFGAGADLSSDTDFPFSIALGDVDGDGDLDAVAGNKSRPNKVYLNNGDGTFGAGTDLNVVTATQGIALGDVDGDGDLDIIVGNQNAGNYLSGHILYLNNGDGTFGFGDFLGWNWDNTRSIALGDVDGDGDLDAVAGNFGGKNTVNLNIGSQAVGSVPTGGGTVTSTDNRTTLTFPASTVTNTTNITVTLATTSTHTPPTGFQTGFYLDINAQDTSTGQPVTQFNGSYTFTYRYTDEELRSLGIGDPASLNIYFFNTTSSQWEAITDGRVVDTSAKTITVTLDHLTEFGIFGSGTVYLPMIISE